MLAVLGGWPRRLAAAACLLAAAIGWVREPAATGDAGSPVQAGVAVLVAAHDLAAGTVLTAADVRSVTVSKELMPAGAVRLVSAVVGRIVAGPMRRGEALTDARVLGPGLAAGLSAAESVAVPVRLADAQTAALVHAGDRVDLLATPVDTGGGSVPTDGSAREPPDGAADVPSGRAGTGTGAEADDPAPTTPAAVFDATLLATGVRVLAVLAVPDAAAADGVLVVVAVSAQAARRLTGAAGQQRLSVALRPP